MTPPANLTNLSAAPGDEQVTLSWTNPPDADLLSIWMRRKVGAFPVDHRDGALVLDQAALPSATLSFVDTDLQNGTEYFYAIFSVDQALNCHPSQHPIVEGENALRATPLLDVTAPGTTTSLQVVPGDGSAIISWQNPQDPDLALVSLLRKQGSAPTGLSDAAAVTVAARSNPTPGGSERVTDTGLTNGLTYVYRTFTQDSAGNINSSQATGSSSQSGVPQPPDVTAPGTCTGLRAIDFEDTQATVSWQNPTDPDFTAALLVRRDDGVIPTGPSDPLATVVADLSGRTPGATESVVDAGLVNGTTVHYAAFPRDAAGNVNASVLSLATADTATPFAPNTWKTTAAPPASLTARQGLALSVDDIAVVVFGGRDASGLSNTGAVYDFSADTWTAMNTVGAPSAREQHTLVTSPTGLVIVWGGFDGANFLNTGAVYDPFSDTWIPTSMVGAPPARGEHNAVFVNGQMFVTCGQDGVNRLNDLFAYTPPPIDTWAQLTLDDAASAANQPSQRRLATALTEGTAPPFTVVWGGDDGAASGTGSFFDHTSAVWTIMSAVGAPSTRFFHRAVSGEFGGNPLFIHWGGQDGGGTSTNTGGVFSPGANAWVATGVTGTTPSTRDQHAALLVRGNRMFVWGGVDSGTTTFRNDGALLDIQDPLTSADDLWTTLPGVGLSVRANPCVALVNGAAFVWGGSDGVTFFDTGAIYIPSP